MANHGMSEILAGGAPWSLKAQCVVCGEEHTALTWSPKKRDYEGPLIRFGTCPACLKADQDDFEARMRELAQPPEKKMPNLEELQQKLDEEEQRDVFDPF